MTTSKDTDTDTAAAYSSPLNWRFDFSSYGETRHFLDQLANLSKRENFYPNVSFGKTYANVSIDTDGQTALGARAAAFIAEMKGCLVQNQV